MVSISFFYRGNCVARISLATLQLAVENELSIAFKPRQFSEGPSA